MDLNIRILRVEMDELREVVISIVVMIDVEVEMIIGGSYRRGVESFGDIDFIVMKRDMISMVELMFFL